MGRVAAVVALLDELGVPHVLIGAVAMGGHGFSRASADVDLLALDARLLRDATWAPLRALGHVVDVRVGDVDDPLAGVIRVDPEADEPVDVVIGSSPRWQAGIIERAQAGATVDGAPTRLPELADLVLLKLYAGGPRDLEDVQGLLALPAGKAASDAVDARIAGMPERVRAAWARLRPPRL